MALKRSYSVTEIKGALRKVRTKLLNGKISAKHFDMDDYMNSCGTVGCIAGWAAIELGVSPRSASKAAFRFSYADPRLDHLFWVSPANPTPKRGAQAIQNYLDGKEPW